MQRSCLIRVIALGVLCSCTCFLEHLEAQSSTQYIFLIDTSGSMVGLPPGSGNAEIFPKVKTELIRYLSGLRHGDIVDIRTFDRGIQSSHVFRIENEETRQAAMSHVQKLDAEGEVTWVYRSILETARAKSEEARRLNALEVPTLFYVFTDGLDNDPQGMRMRDMLERYAKLRRKDDFLIYVTLGVDLPPEDKEAIGEVDYATHHRERRDVIRIGTIHVRARRLDFGFVEGNLSSPRSLALQLDNLDPSEVNLRLQAGFREVEAAGGVVDIEPPTVGFEESKNIQLRIINRESLPEQKFEGELRLWTDKSHIKIIPERIALGLSTIHGPTATVSLPDDATLLDFGMRSTKDESTSERRVQVEFNQSAISEQSGFYVRVTQSGERLPTPTAIWNGEPVLDHLLSAESRFNDLLLRWNRIPQTPGIYQGEIRLIPERLSLQGAALTAQGDGTSSLISYRLEVRHPPAPKWMLALLIFAAFLGFLLVLALLFWILTRTPPWKALRLWMLQNGLAKPRLFGKLVSEFPDEERMELVLSGKEPILLGAGTGTERWSSLADQIEISPRLRQNQEIVTAICKVGDVLYRSGTDLSRPEALSGQALFHNDSLILSDRREIMFLNFERR